MDAYIRNELSVDGNLTLEQAAMHSAKLIAWLLDCQDQMMGQKEERDQLVLNYLDVECMFKATLYLHECYAQLGDQLVKAVLLQSTQAHAVIRRYYDMDRRQCIRAMCANIINGTLNGHTLAPLLYKMHKAYAQLQPAWDIIKDLDWSELSRDKEEEYSRLNVAAMELNIDVLQMHQLVRRIFRLATVEHIKIALKRAMTLISSDLWLHLFRESKESILYTRCYLLRHMICDMLIEVQVEMEDTACSSFVQNIYQFVVFANSGSNLSRLFCWLRHVRFASALGSYFHAYWLQQLPHLQVDDIQCAPEAPLVSLPLDEILYLTHLLLAPKSPCRSRFYQQLQTLPAPHLNRLMQLLNKVAYVYS
ncbi:uncharacterized protein LOC6566323 [Drosophila grimshawi]|uniref:GH24544 n=1 Tax=Drosophila grimshawi TaxID=7222 RepID=B4JLY0_DROGR|nr:uncharacterized protein LOC6566323 [Drosophila grimshawi]EDV91741.1 GH24544 [Drosophila grimshawi]